MRFLYEQHSNSVDRTLLECYTYSMKSSAFIKMIANTYGVPEKTVSVQARSLKEAGLLTTGARGVNAPDMTPLDAARMTIAVLATDSPAQTVERVERFGALPFSPTFDKQWPWYENIGEQRFREIFEGETLEEVLAFLFGRVETLGLSEAASWFNQHIFHLRINDFQILAELVSWTTEDDKPVGEMAVPFRGDPMSPEYPKITGHIRTTRSTNALKFLEIGIQLTEGA